MFRALGQALGTQQGQDSSWRINNEHVYKEMKIISEATHMIRRVIRWRVTGRFRRASLL